MDKVSIRSYNSIRTYSATPLLSYAAHSGLDSYRLHQKDAALITPLIVEGVGYGCAAFALSLIFFVVLAETAPFIESLFQAIASSSYISADNGEASTPTEDVVTPPLPPNATDEDSPTSTNRASNRRHTEVGHVTVMWCTTLNATFNVLLSVEFGCY